MSTVLTPQSTAPEPQEKRRLLRPSPVRNQLLKEPRITSWLTDAITVPELPEIPVAELPAPKQKERQGAQVRDERRPTRASARQEQLVQQRVASEVARPHKWFD